MCASTSLSPSSTEALENHFFFLLIRSTPEDCLSMTQHTFVRTRETRSFFSLGRPNQFFNFLLCISIESITEPLGALVCSMEWMTL
ncbi:hypothetical protein MRB53_007761 [Persea americana]|uniref:Uncharacterized protein n=1 Tax=Persea americana TaxID=3435 RepID=A0ACC2MK72_PERAE|nr:hypothetical protein MRB53_007761 [Persea americana]